MQRRRALCRRLAQRGKFAACTVFCCLSVIRLGRTAALAPLAWLQQQREEGPSLAPPVQPLATLPTAQQLSKGGQAASLFGQRPYPTHRSPSASLSSRGKRSLVAKR